MVMIVAIASTEYLDSLVVVLDCLVILFERFVAVGQICQCLPNLQCFRWQYVLLDDE